MGGHGLISLPLVCINIGNQYCGAVSMLKQALWIKVLYGHCLFVCLQNDLGIYFV